MSAASWSGDLRRGKNADRERAGDEQHLQDALDDVEVGQPAGVVLPPVPERPRRVAARLEPDRPVQKRRELVERVRLEQQDREDRERRGGEARAKRQLGRPARIREPERRDDAATRTSSSPSSAASTPRADRPRDEPEAPDEEARHDRVVRVRVRDVLRERIRRPREREHRAEPLAAEPQPDEPEAEHRQEVEERSR